jgi:hypothetical protein
MSSVIGRTRWSNIGRTLCVSQSFGAPFRIGDQFNAEPDFRERCRADEETIKRLRRDEG